MSRIFGFLLPVTVLSVLSGGAAGALGQQNVYIETPIQSLNDRYYEYFGTSWGVQRWGPRGGFFFNNGFGQALPPFGGYTGGGATLGFGGSGWGFNLVAAQGSSRSIVASAPSVTMIPGTSASVHDMRLRPFVTGIVPIVAGRGDFYTGPSPWGAPVSPPVVLRPQWDANEVRQFLDQRRREKSLALRREEAAANQGAPTVRQEDDPPLILK